MLRVRIFVCLSLLFGLAGCLPESIEHVTVAGTRPLPTATFNTVTAVANTSRTPSPSPTTLASPTQTVIEDFDRGMETPLPTSTPKPPTATPSPSPTPFPTKPWLISLTFPGGDGGTNYDTFFGRGMPDLILFADGQLLLRDKNDDSNNWFENEWYLETHLSPQEIEGLFVQIESFGFFTQLEKRTQPESDWLYNFDETTQFTDGAGGVTLCIFKEERNCISIYGPHIPYLVPEIGNTLTLIQNFHPNEKYYVPYEPEMMILRIQPTADDPATDEVAQFWPEDLPTVRELLERYPSGVAFFQADEAMTYFELFNMKIDDAIFISEGIEYYMIARPLLPAESPRKYGIP